MSGGKGGTSTSTVTIPPEVLARYNSVNANAEKVAQTPFQTYGGQFVAPLNGTQTAGIANTNTAAGQAQPYFGAATNQIQTAQGAYQPYQGAATNLALGAAGPVNAQDLNIGEYLNPFLGTVLGSTANLLNQNNQQQQAGQLGTAIKSGAFGGDRAGIAAANLEQQQNLANANIYSGIASQGFNTALGAAQQQQGVNLSAGQANRNALLASSQQIGNLGQQGYNVGANTATTLAGLGSGAQSAALQGAQAQLAAGQTEQQTAQAGDTALYNQFLQQQSYPFQTAQFLANIAEGTGSLSGNTTTTNTVQNGIFSDRRLKENIKPIGKTFDGQTIYSYHYKGESRPEIGLIAQEVEKKHPEAVGLAGGYKTVHYGKATDDAADRGHFATGGLVPANDREGYYGGGLAYAGGSGFDPAATAQMMANYQAMYGPLLAHGLGGGPGAAGGIVPQATVPVGQLHPAQATVPQGPSMADTVSSYAKAGNTIGQLGDKIGAWHYGKTPASDPSGQTGGDSAGGLGKIIDMFKHKPEADISGSEGNDALSGGSYDDWLGDGYAIGGGVIPYVGAETDPLAIPDDEKRYELKTADTHGSGSGGGGLMDAAKTGLELFFSDKRVKENIKPVGKTFDGQTVYSYRYKGDPTPRMGLIAQEVEKHHPDAVSSMHGLKMVHYGKATSDAAKRGKFAAGGTPFGKYLKAAVNPLGEDSDIGGLIDRAEAHPAAGALTEAGSDDYVPDTAPLVTPSAAPSVVGSGIKAPVSADAPDKIAALIAKAEGTARNPKSSAIGPFQILNATLRANAAAVDPDFAQKIKTMSNAELTAYRAAHPELADTYRAIGQKITNDNFKMLGDNGLPQTAGNTYLAHFLGTGGAKAVLTADPSTPIEKLLGKAAIDANRSILAGKTAGEVAAWAAKRMDSLATKRAAGGRAGYATDGSVTDGSTTDAPTTEDLLDAALTSPAAAKQRAKMPVVDAAPALAAADAAKMADTPPVAAPVALEAGLGTAPKVSAPEDPSKFNFIRGIGRGDARSIIPLLSGIGALATTQTNNPFTAVAAGLGAGAQAAQGQREFGLEQQHVANTTLTAQTQADVAKATAAQTRATTLEHLQDVYAKSIGNAAAMATFYTTLAAYKHDGILTDEDLARFPAPGAPSIASVSTAPSYAPPPGLAAAVPAPSAPAGLAPAVPTPQAESAPAAEAPQTIAQLFPGLVKPSAGPAAPNAQQAGAPSMATPFDNPVQPGDAIHRDFLKGSPEWQQYAALTKQADDITARLTANPVLNNTPIGQAMAKSAEQARQQADVHRANAENQYASQIGPNVAALKAKVAAVTDYINPGGLYERTSNAIQSAADAAATANINNDSSLWGKTIGAVASVAPGLVPDALLKVQGAAEKAGINRLYLDMFSMRGTGVSARAEGTEFGALNRFGASHPGPYAGYDFAVKAKALADQQADYSKALVAAAPSISNESQWTVQWAKQHPLEAYIKRSINGLPLPKGMTQEQAATYIHPAPTGPALKAEIANGARYVNVRGRGIFEVNRSGQRPMLVPWTGR